MYTGGPFLQFQKVPGPFVNIRETRGLFVEFSLYLIRLSLQVEKDKRNTFGTLDYGTIF